MHVIGLVALLIVAFLFGLIVQYKLINTNGSHKLISNPSFRRRHRNSTPLTGGVGIFLTFVMALIAITPYFGIELLMRFGPIGVALFMVFSVGLVDDRYTIPPKLKLLGELVAAFIVLLSPDVQEFAFGWQNTIGFAIWPLILFWIVGVTNAINLIDGLDGLAVSYGILALTAIALSGIAMGVGTDFQVPIVIAMITSLIPFYFFNRKPARVFLGDNGSLLLGFFIAVFAMLKPAGQSGWNETMSIILVAGLPLLDMGWVTWTRINKGFSPFAADRSHIHYRLLKFKLTVPEIVKVMMAVNLIFLFTSYIIIEVKLENSLITLATVGASIFILLKLIHNYDRWKNAILSDSPLKPSIVEQIPESTEAILVVDIRPIYQALDTTDQKVIEAALDSLSGHLNLLYRRKDGFYVLRNRSEFQLAIPKDADQIYHHVSETIKQWLQFYDIAISLPNLPIVIVESSKWADTASINRDAA